MVHLGLRRHIRKSRLSPKAFAQTLVSINSSTYELQSSRLSLSFTSAISGLTNYLTKLVCEMINLTSRHLSSLVAYLRHNVPFLHVHDVPSLRVRGVPFLHAHVAPVPAEHDVFLLLLRDAAAGKLKWL